MKRSTTVDDEEIDQDMSGRTTSAAGLEVSDSFHILIIRKPSLNNRSVSNWSMSINPFLIKLWIWGIGWCSSYNPNCWMAWHALNDLIIRRLIVPVLATRKFHRPTLKRMRHPTISATRPVSRSTHPPIHPSIHPSIYPSIHVHIVFNPIVWQPERG